MKLQIKGLKETMAVLDILKENGYKVSCYQAVTFPTISQLPADKVYLLEITEKE